jgi:putative CocE/NonD family hydrolase
MRDGTVLRADIYRPDAGGKFPILLKRTPYDKSVAVRRTAYLDPIRAASHGYAVVIQDVRGRYASDGDFSPFFQEIDDGYDTVEWCAGQPYSSGRVGMFGRSYHGATQWLAACQAPAALQAIYPGITASDYHEGWTYQGGAACWGFLLSWATNALALDNFAKLSRDKGFSSDIHQRLARSLEDLERCFRFLPLQDYPYLKDGLAPYFYDWLAHPSADDYWRPVKIEDHHERIRVAAFNAGGWFDIFLKGTIRNFAGMRARGPREVRDRQRLLIGPWHHTAPFPSVSGSTYFGKRSGEIAVDLPGTLLRWYDHWLKDEDNGIVTEPAVRLFIMGKNLWRYETGWPLPQTQATRYYFHSQGRANTLSGDGRLDRDAPESEPPDVYAYDPRDPVPSRGGGLCCYDYFVVGGCYDQREIEVRPDVLCYTSAPLERDLEVTGPVTVTLFAVSSAPDTDFTAKLVDVCPCGCARNVADGIVRGRYRESLATPALVEPGAAYRYDVDLVATANVFQPGHRIRVEISSSNFPRFDRNPNTGREIAGETELRPALQTVLHDAAHPSYISLPIIPAG